MTTWVNQRKTGTGDIAYIYNQIDYILVPQQHKHVLENARSYGGTETDSDHKLVRMEMNIKWCNLYKKAVKQETTKKFDTSRLATDTDVQKSYADKLNESIRELARTGELKWENIKAEITKEAEETIGYRRKVKHQKFNDPEIVTMSKEQQKIRLEIVNTQDTEEIDKLKKKRKNILKELMKKVAERTEKEVDSIVANIDTAQDDARMF